MYIETEDRSHIHTSTSSGSRVVTCRQCVDVVKVILTGMRVARAHSSIRNNGILNSVTLPLMPSAIHAPKVGASLVRDATITSQPFTQYTTHNGTW